MDSANLKYWLMVILIATMMTSLTVWIHETTHAIVCIVVGGQVQEYSALHVDCGGKGSTGNAGRIVAASGAITNVVLASMLYFVLTHNFNRSGNWKWFLWLMMFANFSTGFGYLMFSGFSGVGDYAVVIDGWEPALVWRVGMIVIGAGLWFGSVWLSLIVLAKIFGSGEKSVRKRFLGLGIPTYFSVLVVALIVGALNPYGFGGLPSIAGLMARAGTLSPLIWTPFWFESAMFEKKTGEPVTVEFNMIWVIVAAGITIVYALLGRGLTF